MNPIDLAAEIITIEDDILSVLKLKAIIKMILNIKIIRKKAKSKKVVIKIHIKKSLIINKKSMIIKKINRNIIAKIPKIAKIVII